MPPWRLSGAALFAQLICPRRFFVPARLLFFCFYSWPLGGEPYSLGLFYHGGILIPARFFVISHWPALGGRPYLLGLFCNGRILIPARFFVTSHWPALGGGPHSPGLFCNGGIRVPAQLISIPVQRTIRSRLPGKNPGGKNIRFSAFLQRNRIPLYRRRYPVSPRLPSCLPREGQGFFSSAISLEA